MSSIVVSSSFGQAFVGVAAPANEQSDWMRLGRIISTVTRLSGSQGHRMVTLSGR